MKSSKFRERRTVIATFFMLLFSFTIVNSSLYLHSHVKAGGNIVAHAHPYSQDDADEPIRHEHSTEEEKFISSINGLWIDNVDAALLPKIKFSCVRLLSAFHDAVFVKRITRDIPSRAPPLGI